MNGLNFYCNTRALVKLEDFKVDAYNQIEVIESILQNLDLSDKNQAAECVNAVIQIRDIFSQVNLPSYKKLFGALYPTLSKIEDQREAFFQFLDLCPHRAEKAKSTLHSWLGQL